MNRIEMRARLATLLMCLLASLASTAVPATARAGADNDCEGSIKDARYVASDTTHIFVVLAKPINNQDLKPGGQASLWSLADLSVTPVRDIPVKNVEPDNKAEAPTFTSIKLTIGEPLTKGHIYRLVALNLTFLGCSPDNKPASDISFSKLNVKPPSTSTFFPRSKSKGRDDSNVYIQGGIEGARGGKAQFSSDIKIDVPYEFKTKRKRDTKLGPYFNLKASTAEGADADSLSTGAKLSTIVGTWNSGFVRNLVWSPTVGIEADRRFRNINGVIGNTLYFVTAGNKDTFKKRIYFQPFIGYELGRNFKSPVQEAEGRGISRLNAGGSLYFTIPLQGDRAFSIQGDYIRRFLLRREVSFKEDDDKKLVLLNVGKGPRDYLKTNFQYDFAKFTALTLSYEYGRLPPNFELVNHKYSLGLLLKFGTKFVQK
ncbi:MAG: hypothetical protein WCD76_07375 [Pyrinomonadaceae bacterium]